MTESKYISISGWFKFSINQSGLGKKQAVDDFIEKFENWLEKQEQDGRVKFEYNIKDNLVVEQEKEQDDNEAYVERENDYLASREE